jgi:DNA-binding transcriptional LysR family regulator
MSLAGLRSDGAKLTRLDVQGPRLLRPIYVVLHADKHVSPALQALLDMTHEAVRDP